MDAHKAANNLLVYFSDSALLPVLNGLSIAIDTSAPIPSQLAMAEADAYDQRGLFRYYEAIARIDSGMEGSSFESWLCYSRFTIFFSCLLFAGPTLYFLSSVLSGCSKLCACKKQSVLYVHNRLEYTTSMTVVLLAGMHICICCCWLFFSDIVDGHHERSINTPDLVNSALKPNETSTDGGTIFNVGSEEKWVPFMSIPPTVCSALISSLGVLLACAGVTSILSSYPEATAKRQNQNACCASCSPHSIWGFIQVGILSIISIVVLCQFFVYEEDVHYDHHSPRTMQGRIVNFVMVWQLCLHVFYVFASLLFMILRVNFETSSPTLRPNSGSQAPVDTPCEKTAMSNEVTVNDHNGGNGMTMHSALRVVGAYTLLVYAVLATIALAILPDYSNTPYVVPRRIYGIVLNAFMLVATSQLLHFRAGWYKDRDIGMDIYMHNRMLAVATAAVVVFQVCQVSDEWAWRLLSPCVLVIYAFLPGYLWITCQASQVQFTNASRVAQSFAVGCIGSTLLLFACVAGGIPIVPKTNHQVMYLWFTSQNHTEDYAFFTLFFVQTVPFLVLLGIIVNQLQLRVNSNAGPQQRQAPSYGPGLVSEPIHHTPKVANALTFWF